MGPAPTGAKGPSTRAVVATCIVLLGVFVAAVVWLGVRSLMVVSELEALVPLSTSAEAAASTGDVETLGVLAGDIAHHASRAASLTGDPVWTAAEAFPVAGENLAAVRMLVTGLDDAARAGRSLLDALPQSDAPASAAGIDLASIEATTVPLAALSDAVQRTADELSALDGAVLVGPLGDAVDTVSDATTAATPLLRSLSGAARVLPDMLGGHEPRTILVMMQNNAEVRTGGGITGSFAYLRVVDGDVSLLAQADSTEFTERTDPILPIPEATTALYGDVVGRWVQNTSIPADFAVTAELATAWWQDKTGERPDAVISIDAVMIRALLSAAGAVPLPDGTELSADTVVQRLLLDPYLALDPDQQTAFQRDVTAATIDHVLSGRLDPLSAMRALAQPLADGHAAAWSSRPDEQAALAGTVLGGPLERHRQAGADTYAIYFNDVTGGKMDLFLDSSVDVTVRSCRADDRREVTITLTMASTAPADIETYPFSVTGGGLQGTGLGDIGTLVSIAAPPGSFFTGVQKNGLAEPSTQRTDDGYPTSVARVNLSPGEINTMAYTFVAAEPGPVDPRIIHTPLVNDLPVTVSQVGCE